MNRLIMLTQKHNPSATDQLGTQLIDLDLSILGSSSTYYQEYTKNIRKEYTMIPNMLYNPGRIKVINSFLELDKIFKTPQFESMEIKARVNLTHELESYLL